MKIIEDHIEEIKVLCHQQRVKALYVFGSVLTEAFNESSDIDLLVEFEKVDPIDYLDHYYGLKFKLEEILGREIDLLEAQSMSNPVFKESIDKQKLVIYERGSTKLVN